MYLVLITCKSDKNNRGFWWSCVGPLNYVIANGILWDFRTSNHLYMFKKENRACALTYSHKHTCTQYKNDFILQNLDHLRHSSVLQEITFQNVCTKEERKTNDLKSIWLSTASHVFTPTGASSLGLPPFCFARLSFLISISQSFRVNYLTRKSLTFPLQALNDPAKII